MNVVFLCKKIWLQRNILGQEVACYSGFLNFKVQFLI